jgi:hypothetical protein
MNVLAAGLKFATFSIFGLHLLGSGLSHCQVVPDSHCSESGTTEVVVVTTPYLHSLSQIKVKTTGACFGSPSVKQLRVSGCLG